MVRVLWFLLIVAAAGWIVGVAAPQQMTESLVKDLLRIPAPAPPTASGQDEAKSTQAATPPKTFGPPPDDAPAEILARYWGREFGRSPEQPSDRVRQRLLEACETAPEYLAALLKQLPDTPAALARIKAIFDAELSSPRFEPGWREAVKRHLTYHSPYFLKELAAAAGAAHDDAEIPKGEEDLKALARLDWKTAEPILKVHTASPSLRVGAIALALLYSHAVEIADADGSARYRAELRRLVEDRTRPGRARNTAAEALLTTQWQGRDEWYWSLFRDSTLRDLKDGYMMFSPLCGIAMDQTRWIAALATRVADADPVAHDAAVSCLVAFHLDNARRDALLPLLPWLNNPKWSSARDRLRLIQSMDRIEMPEAVPGLIAVLGQDDDAERSYAAESLAHYKDLRAIPGLKRALGMGGDGADRRRVISALAACGGITDNDAARAVEAFASQIATEKGAQELSTAMWDSAASKRLPAAVMMGQYLSGNPPNDSVVDHLLERARGLQAQNPALAKSLLGIIDKWPRSAIDKDLVNRIANGKADAAAVHSVLLRRDSLRQTARPELERLAGATGTPAGVAAVLLGDIHREEAIMGGSDLAAQAALLASARLIREPIAVPRVGDLLGSPNTVLAEVAEAYLTMDDSTTARALLLARHSGEVVILGERQVGDPGHNTYPAFDFLEKQLLEDVRAGSEVYALLSDGYWGSAGQIIVRLSGGSAEVMHSTDPARYYVRTLAPAELTGLREFVASSRIEDRGPLATAVSDGMQYEYVHITRSGGHRVFMNNPGLAGTGGSVYDQTCARFMRLLSGGKFVLKYRAAAAIPGFEVPAADSGVSVLTVWKEKGEIRLLTEKGGRSPGGAVSVQGEAGALVSVAQEAPGKPEWVFFAGGKIGPATQSPPSFGPLDPTEGVPRRWVLRGIGIPRCGRLLSVVTRTASRVGTARTDSLDAALGAIPRFCLKAT